jgi:AraC family transcriptional regulator, positive regulator of tynA and feaB
MTDLWSTTEVHPRDRRAWWVEVICAKCHVDCEPEQDAQFFGQASLADIGQKLQIGNGVSRAQVLTRSPRQIARGDDRLFITVATSGRSFVKQDGREAVLTRGDFALTDRTRYYQFTSDGEFSQTVLMVPRDLLLRRVGSVESFTSVRIDGQKSFGGLLSPMLQNLPVQLSAIPADLHARLAENIVDLIATALLSEREDVQSTAQMTYVRVKFWIETHLTEELSADRIAAVCGVSVRHLNRLFARDGTSLMQYVWERRLERCRLALTDPRMAHRPISEIALAAGFRDLSHFSRAYRTRYGRSPRNERTLIIG